MHSLKDEKNELRKQCTLIRDQLDPAKKEEADKKIVRLFTGLSSYRFASLVLLYAPIKSEIDVRPIMYAALEGGKRLALPLCEKEPGIMTFRLIEDPKELVEGAFGVPEPSQNAPVCSAEMLRQKDSIVAVPALAFDRQGYRLGYGKGYYDRFLSDFGGVSVGLLYRNLLLDRVPRGFYDRKVDLLISEKGVSLPHA